MPLDTVKPSDDKIETINGAIDADSNPKDKEDKNFSETAKEFAEVGQKVIEAVKICQTRAETFLGISNIFNSDQEDKKDRIEKSLTSESSNKIAEEDTSFSIFKNIALGVSYNNDYEEEKKLDFLKQLTQEFSFIGKEIEDMAKTTQEETVKLFDAFYKTCQDEQFGQIVIDKFKDVFADVLSAPIFKGIIEEKKEPEEKPEPVKKDFEEPIVQEKPKKEEEKKEEVKEELEPVKAEEKVQQEKGKKGEIEKFLDNLTMQDKAIIGGSLAAFIALSVALPGVGTVIGFALIAGASTMMSKSERTDDKEQNQNQDRTVDHVDQAIADFVKKNSSEMKSTTQALQNSREALEELTKNSVEEEVVKEEVKKQGINELTTEVKEDQKAENVEIDPTSVTDINVLEEGKKLEKENPNHGAETDEQKKDLFGLASEDVVKESPITDGTKAEVRKIIEDISDILPSDNEFNPTELPQNPEEKESKSRTT